LRQWADRHAAEGAKAAFVETALLRTAGLDRVVDEIWHVTAPVEVRIKRVMARSGLTAQQVRDRMEAQIAEEQIADGEHVIINDNVTAILPQVLRLLTIDHH
jgi:dephospho-CoA kinase